MDHANSEAKKMLIDLIGTSNSAIKMGILKEKDNPECDIEGANPLPRPLEILYIQLKSG